MASSIPHAVSGLGSGSGSNGAPAPLKTERFAVATDQKPKVRPPHSFDPFRPNSEDPRGRHLLGAQFFEQKMFEFCDHEEDGFSLVVEKRQERPQTKTSFSGDGVRGRTVARQAGAEN